MPTTPLMLDLLAPYAAQLRAEGASAQTIDRYTRLLRLFAAWADPCVTPDDMTAPLLTQYQIALSQADQAARSIRLALHALRSFCRWCLRCGYRADDPTLALTWPKAPRSKPKALSSSEIARLHAALAAPIRGRSRSLALWKRNTLVIYLMLYAGLRLGEVCTLRWEHLDLGAGVLRVLDGKGRKDRDIPLAAELWALLEAVPIAAQVGPVIAAGWRTSKGLRPLNESGMAKIFRVWLPGIGIAGIHAHRLRHTCAHYMQINGADVRDIQRILGHESLDTTALYLGEDMERLRAAIDRLPPLGELGQRRTRGPRLRLVEQPAEGSVSKRSPAS